MGRHYGEEPVEERATVASAPQPAKA
jgi:hypothetical protein